MQVRFEHGEYKKGLVFAKRFYTVTTHVTFSAEEKAIIKTRRLEKDIVMQRNPPVNAKVTNVNASLSVGNLVSAGKVLTGLGKTANGFHLLIGDLVKGPDTYTLETPLEAKAYEAEVMKLLHELKAYILGNAEGGQNKSIEI